jgi:hypothetical protein
MNQEEKELWQKMADLTYEKCRKTCLSLGNCCHGLYCEMAAEAMDADGEKVPPMPFVVDGKCIIPPHYRKICTIHQCKINSMGFDKDDPEWTKRYFSLRDRLEDIGFEELEKKQGDSHG